MSNVKQLKEFLAKENDSKTLSIVPVNDELIDKWIEYADDKDYVEIIDTAMSKVAIATLSN